MVLKRIGVLLFGVGVGLATLSAVVFGPAVAATEMACPGHDPSYAIQAVDLLTLSIEYTDGCNTFLLNPLITVGSLAAVAGLSVGLGGVLQARVASD